MQIKRVLTNAAAGVAAVALVLGSAAGLAHADEDGSSSTTTSSSATTTASPSPSASPTSDTATATIGVKQQNVTVVTLTVSDTATSTITVKDGRGGQQVTWDVPAGTKVSGFYKELRDVKPGFTIHLKGTRTGSANPVADHVVVPGRNKKVEARSVTVTAVDGAAGTITTRDGKGRTFTWSVRGAKVEGKARSTAALSAGDVVSVRGTSTEGTAKGSASVVRVEKDVPAKGKSKGKGKGKK